MSEKLFYIERGDALYDEVAIIPEEYLDLIMPYADVYYETDAICDIISQHRQVGPFSIWVQEVFAHEALTLCPYTPHHIWALHFMYETSVEVELYKDNNFSLSERECNLFSLEADLHRVPLERGQRLLSCHINIRPENLKALAINHPELSRLAEKQSIGISGPLNQYPYHINQVCGYLLQQMLTCRHIEMPADKFLYRCCLELFKNFARQDLLLPLRVTDALHTDDLSMVFRLISENPHHAFTVQQLSSIAGLSPLALREGFLQHYSMTLDEFLLMVNNMMVFELLTEKNTPLSAIAEAAGYKKWIDLNEAFRAYYGCDLDELRRAM